MSSRQSLALWLVAIALIVARGALAASHSMSFWALDLLRFLDSYWGWQLWGTALLVIALSELRPIGESLDELVTPAPGPPATVAMICGAALLALALRDNAWFTGDTIWLQSGGITGAARALSFPQMLPVEWFVHDTIPRLLFGDTTEGRQAFFRAIGAVEAAGLAALSLRYSGILGRSGWAGVVTSAIVFFGSYLALFTGFGRAWGETTILTAAVCVFGVSTIRNGRGLVAMAVALAMSMGVHRFALFLIPGAVMAGVIWWRRHGSERRDARGRAVLISSLPLAVLLMLLPDVVRILNGYDIANNVSRVGGPIGWFSTSVSPLRALDMLNLIVQLSPMILAVPLVLALRGFRGLDRAEGAFLGVMAASTLLTAALVVANKGLYRDWDMLAPAGVALSVLTAWLLGAVIRGGEWDRRAAIAVVACVSLYSIQFMAHNHDMEQGLRRAKAFVLEPPKRPTGEAVWTWDYIGERNAMEGRWSEAADAFIRATAERPTPRLTLLLAVSSTGSGDYDQAKGAYRRLLAASPDDPVVWLGLTGIASREGDSSGVARGMNRVLAYAREPRRLERMRQILSDFPAVWPDRQRPGPLR